MKPTRLAAIRLAWEAERVRGERDARYRANLACAVTQVRKIVVTVLAITSIAAGWPVAPATMVMSAASEVRDAWSHLEADPAVASDHTSRHSRSPRDRLRSEGCVGDRPRSPDGLRNGT